MGINLITEAESFITDAEQHVKDWWTEADTYIRQLGAMVLADLKVAATAGLGAFTDIAKSKLAGITQWLKDEAQVVVGLMQQQYGDFLTGDVKFGAAVAALWNSIVTKVVPGLQGVGLDALKSLFSMATLKTVLQMAFATMTVAGSL